MPLALVHLRFLHNSIKRYRREHEMSRYSPPPSKTVSAVSNQVSSSGQPNLTLPGTAESEKFLSHIARNMSRFSDYGINFSGKSANMKKYIAAVIRVFSRGNHVHSPKLIFYHRHKYQMISALSAIHQRK